MMLETKRLILREMTPNDVDDLLEVFSDPEAMQFYPQPFDRQMTQTWIERNIQRYAQHGFGLWASILKQTDKLIGDCGLVVQEVDGVEEIEIVPMIYQGGLSFKSPFPTAASQKYFPEANESQPLTKTLRIIHHEASA